MHERVSDVHDHLDGRVGIPDDWPKSIVTNTAYLPDADGFLPREVVVDAQGLAAALKKAGLDADQVAAHEPLGGGKYRLIVAGDIEHPVTVAGFLARMDELYQDGAEFSHSSLREAGGTIEAYFADYEAFCFAFDLWMVPLVAAAQLGATGRGTFLFDDDCEEPVCFDIELAPNKNPRRRRGSPKRPGRAAGTPAARPFAGTSKPGRGTTATEGRSLRDFACTVPRYGRARSQPRRGSCGVAQ